MNGKACGINEEKERNGERQFVRRGRRGEGITTWNRISDFIDSLVYCWFKMSAVRGRGQFAERGRGKGDDNLEPQIWWY